MGSIYWESSFTEGRSKHDSGDGLGSSLFESCSFTGFLDNVLGDLVLSLVSIVGISINT